MAPALLCRLCSAPLTRTFVDLGSSPPCERFLREPDLTQPEAYYPLHVRTCDTCLLVQLPAHLAPEEIFSDYAYFSSFSDSWVRHAQLLVDEWSTGCSSAPTSLVVEVASNDGYLLQHVLARGVPCPRDRACRERRRGRTREGDPDRAVLLLRGDRADVRRRHGAGGLVAANNVLAHVPDPSAREGHARRARRRRAGQLEFPHLLRLIEGRQYDTIYHEHYSY